MSVHVKRILVLVAMLLVVFWAVPSVFGEAVRQILMGAVDGWQLGTWAYDISARIFPE